MGVWSVDDSRGPLTNTMGGNDRDPWETRRHNTGSPPNAPDTRVTIGANGWMWASPAERPYICEKKNRQNAPGLCRWDAYRANVNINEACMCPATELTCRAERPQCHWYKDPNSVFKECISNSERFYGMLQKLLLKRGKKDFAIKIRYGATAARGKLPLGPWGPSIIGHGDRHSMMSRRPMGGMMGRPSGGMFGRPSGGMFGHQFGGGMMGGGMFGRQFGGGMFGRQFGGGMMGGGFGGMSPHQHHGPMRRH